MQTTITYLKYVVAIVVVLLLGALGGWYFYLNKSAQVTVRVDTMNATNTSGPSFESQTGGRIENTTDATGETSASGSPLWHIDRNPVAGMAFIQSAHNARTELFFALRANGNVLRVDPSSRTKTRLTNTLKAKTYEASFASNGGIIGRSIDANGTITTFAGEISTTTGLSVDTASSSAPDSLKGSYLPTNIKALALGPTGSFVYTIANTTGGIDVVTRGWKSAQPKVLWSSNIASWQLSLLPDGRIILVESPADSVFGYAYSIDAKGGLGTISRGLPGLNLLAQSGSEALLISTSANGIITLYTQVSAASSPLESTLRTIVDKCVWGPFNAAQSTTTGEQSNKTTAGKNLVAYCAVPQGDLPRNFIDMWYRGEVHTSDDWWKIDLQTGNVTMIYSPSSANVSLDVAHPTIDPTGSYIAFQNAADASLWLLKIPQ